MLPATLEQITLSDLQQLISDQEQEGKYIEYKSAAYRLSSKEPKDKIEQREELLKDVSSFANTEGGDLVIGMTEDGGVPLDTCGVEAADPDAFKLQYLQIIQSGLEPRISVAMHFVKREDGRCIFIIRVPKSLVSPHRVVCGKYPGQFWARTSGGTYMMDTSELRRAFTLSETLLDRIREFHSSRVSRAIDRDTPVLLGDGSKLVLHLIPFASFASRQFVEIKALQTLQQKLPPLGDVNSWSGRINLDGVVTHDINDPRIASFAYVQAFRNGVIESVANELTFTLRTSNDQTRYFQNQYLPSIRKVLPSYLAFQKQLGIPTPIWMFLTLTEMKDVEIHTRRAHLRLIPACDRDTISLPEVEIASYEADLDAIVKPLFDMVWNVFGQSSMPGID